MSTSTCSTVYCECSRSGLGPSASWVHVSTLWAHRPCHRHQRDFCQPAAIWTKHKTTNRHQPENRPCFQSMVGFALCFGADQRTVATNNQRLDRQGDGDQPAQRWSRRKLSCDQELIWVNCCDNLGLLWIYHDISIVFMGAINQGSDIFRDTNVEDIKEY